MSQRSGGGADFRRGIIYALLGGAASAVGDALVTRFASGEVRVSSSILLGVLVAIAIWVVWALLAKAAADRRRRTRGMGVYVAPSQMTEARQIGEYPFAGVKWRVVERVHVLDDPFERGIHLDRLEVQTPPRCPTCGTELNKSQRYWGSWDWECPGGDFSVRQSRDYELVAHDVLKLVRRDIERNREEKSKQHS